MPDIYLTPSLESNALSRLRPRYATAQWRLRQLAAGLDDLEPVRADYASEVEFEWDFTLWQGQQASLLALQAFLCASRIYLEEGEG